ncbi:hypothetical protein SF83666_c19290 [Sinorhizobium fredii CCBAU 83666]|nr:hypothetical protein SF83666_c19290 [Sinorhizobium fredii CCBAU 83666]
MREQPRLSIGQIVFQRSYSTRFCGVLRGEFSQLCLQFGDCGPSS